MAAAPVGLLQSGAYNGYEFGLCTQRVKTMLVHSDLLGTAKVDDVGSGKTGIVGEESIFRRAWHVDDVLVLHSFRILVSGLSHHDCTTRKE